MLENGLIIRPHSKTSVNFSTVDSGFFMKLTKYWTVERFCARVLAWTCSYWERLKDDEMHYARCTCGNLLTRFDVLKDDEFNKSWHAFSSSMYTSFSHELWRTMRWQMLEITSGACKYNSFGNLHSVKDHRTGKMFLFLSTIDTALSKDRWFG